MMRVENTVKKRITEKHVRMCHIDLRTKHLLAFCILSGLHLTEKLEVLLYATVTVRALGSRNLNCTATLTDLLLSLIVDICKTLLDVVYCAISKVIFTW